MWMLVATTVSKEGESMSTSIDWENEDMSITIELKGSASDWPSMDEVGTTYALLLLGLGMGRA